MIFLVKDSAMIINLKAANLFRKHGYDYDANIAFGCNYIYYINNKNYPKAKEAFEAYQSTNYQGNTNYDDSKAFCFTKRVVLYVYEQLKYCIYMSSTKLKT